MAGVVAVNPIDIGLIPTRGPVWETPRRVALFSPQLTRRAPLLGVSDEGPRVGIKPMSIGLTATTPAKP